MPNEAATQHRPADAPAPIEGPRPKSLPRKIANTVAAIKLSTNAPPKITAMLPLFACSSERPETPCQVLPSNIGEYHRPPRAKDATPHSSTAIQLTSGNVLSLFFSVTRPLWPSQSGRAALAARSDC